MQFNFHHLNTGCYTVVNFSTIDTTGNVESKYDAVDYDVTEDSYLVSEEQANNFLQIDTLDFNSKRVSGKFMVTFKRNYGSLKKYNPEYVRFFNGEFHCNMNW